MCVYNPVRVGWVMDSRGEEPEAWCWSPQVQAQRWHWGRPHPPQHHSGVVQLPPLVACGEVSALALSCARRSAAPHPQSGSGQRDSLKLPFFLLANRPGLPLRPRTLSLVLPHGLASSPPATTPQLDEVREHVFQECGRQGSQPGLDNHRGKYLPSSWSQYCPPWGGQVAYS